MTRLLEYADKKNPGHPIDLKSAMSLTPAVISNWKARGVSKEGALAAEKLIGCSAHWVLTGKGSMFPARGWPFTHVSPEEIARMGEEDWLAVENFTLFKLGRPQVLAVKQVLQRENRTTTAPGQHVVFHHKETEEYRDQRSSDEAESPRKRGGGESS